MLRQFFHSQTVGKMNRFVRPGIWILLLTFLLADFVLIENGTVLADVSEDNGIRLSFDIEPANKSSASDDIIREGQMVSFDFTINDINDVPLSGLYPAAWIHPSSANEIGNDEICLNKVKTFISGSLLSRSELDLNVYYVIVLNDDATISIVDPLFGFGGSKLLAMLGLEGPGYDWVVNYAQDKVYVSVPSANHIAVIEVNGWTVKPAAVDYGLVNPRHVFLQPDQQNLWVLADDGAVVLNATTMEKQGHVKTATQASALEFSEDGRSAYLLDAEYLHVVDINSMTISRSIRRQPGLASIAYSGLAGTLYLRHSTNGDIWLIDDRTHSRRALIESDPGAGDFKISPDGRWGMLVNRVNDRLSIIDTARQRIVQSGVVQQQPEYIAFSDDLAYIRHAGSSDLFMLPLDDKDLGREGANIPTIDTPGGDQSPGLVAMPSGGEAIVQVPGSNAVLVANYNDKMIYFYKEGMAAPMGSFNNYGKHPRSILAIDHSLRERNARGVYSSYAGLPEAGVYEAVFFMDSPRVVKCFPFTIATAVDSITRSADRLLIRDLTAGELSAHKNNTIVYSLASGSGVSLEDELFSIDIILASGQWRERYSVKVDEKNEIRLDITPPLSGVYGVYVNAVNTDKFLASEQFSYEIF